MKHLLFLSIFCTIIVSSLAMEPMPVATGKSDEFGRTVVNEVLWVDDFCPLTITEMHSYLFESDWDIIFEPNTEMVTGTVSHYRVRTDRYFHRHSILPTLPAFFPIKLFENKKVGDSIELATTDDRFLLILRCKKYKSANGSPLIVVKQNNQE